MVEISATAPATAAANPAVAAIARVSREIGDSTYRLASGNRIVRTADEPSTITIAATLQSQISTLRQGQVNSGAAGSLLEVASSALARIGTLLETLEGLTRQADDATLTDNARVFLDTGFQDTRAAIDAIVSTTRFGGRTLLDGSNSPFLFAVGENGGNVSVEIDAVDSTTLFAGATPDIATQASAQTTLPLVQTARETFGIVQAEVNASLSELRANADGLAAAIGDIDTARGSLLNTNVPREQTRLAALTLQQQVGLSVTAQTQSFNSDLLNLLQFA
ncbi:MAG: flagellin [Rickettsiales bacterium]